MAVLVIGLWSGHHCAEADRILHELCPKVNVFLKKCRNNNMKVIFGSLSLTKLPKYAPLKNNMKNIPYARLIDKGMSFPPLPFDDSDGGIVSRNLNFSRVGVDIHPSIEIFDTDAMSDNCKEILNYLHYHNIKHLMVLGAHTNMCVLDRAYGIKNLSRYGFPMSIVRDLTDPMVNPDGILVKDRQDASEQIIRFIEQHFCPSVDSKDVIFLAENKKLIRCDIDDTICKNGPSIEGQDNHPYKIKVPITGRIEKMNQLYDEGHSIIYWTSRGSESGKDWTPYTREQLDNWGVKYSAIICGKPLFDIFIDDKVHNSETYFE